MSTEQHETPSSTTAALDEVLKHYDLGQYRLAYEAGLECFGALEQWPGIAGRLLAGRVAYNLGAPRWAKYWHLRLCREFPNCPETSFYHYSLLLSYRGPLEVWRQLAYEGWPDGLSTQQEAELLSLRAQVFAMLRDFPAAMRDLDRAAELIPDHLWVLVEKHSVLAAMDQREAALETTARALEIRPFYRPAVRLHAYQLVQLNRDDEAEALLLQAAAHNQCGDLWTQLGLLYTETQRHDRVAECLDHAEAQYILMSRDKKLTKWMASRRSDLAYRRGDYHEAIRLAEQVDAPFFKSVAQSMKEALERPLTENRRVLLGVQFVRQNHLTCAPATLTALCSYWQHPVDHIDLAQSICYDGTPAHEERNWVERQGFVAREFRVTWENARQLIDRGIPFTLTTVGPQMGHLQPVIGYDDWRGVLLVRDPGERHHIEYRGQELLDHFSASGPRGMAMVPRERQELLADLELEDSVFYDLTYDLHRAIHLHDRQGAATCLQRMETLDPDHRLTLHARASLAFYDQDRVRQLKSVAPLADRFPKDSNQQLARLALLRELGRRDDFMQRLQQLCDDSEALPIYWRMLAFELLDDQRTLGEAKQYLDKILRQQQTAEDLRLASRYCWRVGQRDLATQVMRLAALSDHLDESLAADYFASARANGQTQAALDFLQQRHRDFGRQSAGPTYTYAWALESCDQHQAADQALDEGLAWRPDDGDSKINAAQFYIGWGRPDAARRLIEEAESITSRSRWLNTAARFAMIFEDLETQEKLYREALELQPLNLNLVHALVETLANRQGREAAIRFVEDYLQQFSEHYELRQLWIGLLRSGEISPRWVDELNRMLELHPDDPWSLREMASVLLDLHRPEEALHFAERALVIEPHVAASWSIKAFALSKLGQREEASAAFEESLRQSIDWESGFQGWMELCETREQRLHVLEVVQRELQAQVVTGDLLLSLTDYVQPTLDDQQALSLFREMHAARPDLFQSWLALCEILQRQDYLDEAQELMEQALVKFALLPRVWSDAASLAERRQEPARQIECLKQALSINPRWSQIVYRLAMVLYDQGQTQEAFDSLHSNLAQSPRDPLLRCGLGELLWKDQQPEAAIEAMTAVVRNHPDFGHAWDCLQTWVNKLDKPEWVTAAAEQLAQTRPNEVYSWTLLVDVLPANEETWEQRYEALQHALKINPHSTDVLRRLAALQAERGEFQQAVQTCQTLIHGKPSRTLQLCELDLLADYRSLQEATQRLQVMLEEDPDSGSLWYRLADWSEKIGDWETYHRATQQLVRTAPGNCISWGYRADSLLRQEQVDEAIRHFEKAVKLDPAYEFAAANLSEQLLKQDRVDELRTLLDRIRPHASSGFVQSLEMQLALHRKDQTKADEIFQQLLDQPEIPESYVQQCLRYMEEAEAADNAWQLLRSRMDSGNSLVGRLWAVAALKRGKAATIRCLQSLLGLPTNEAWTAAVTLLLRYNDDHIENRAGLRLIEKRRADLMADNDTWCAGAGYLIDVDTPQYWKWMRNRRCRRWLAAWENREGLTPEHWYQLIRVAAALQDWSMVRAMGDRCYGDPRLVPTNESEMIRLWYIVGLLIGEQWEQAIVQVQMFRDFEIKDYYVALRKYLREVAAIILQIATDETAVPSGVALAAVKQWQANYAKSEEYRVLVKNDAFWRVNRDIETSIRRLIGHPLPWWMRIYRALRV